MYPISKYEYGKWTFIKEFNGSYEDALKESNRLQILDQDCSYRIWDCRVI